LGLERRASIRALIITSVHWPATARLGFALTKAGFSVAAVGPANHGLRALKQLDRYYVCHPHIGRTSSIGRAIDAWSPDLVIPGDDPALYSLHQLHANATCDRGKNAARRRVVIERSLGDAERFDLIAKKSEFVAFANALGVATPPTTVIQDRRDLNAATASVAFPAVLKTDGS
jgi:hypothetical protein